MSKNIAVRFVSEDCYLVPSDSIEGHSYVLRRKYGQWTCSCRGFILSCLKRNTNCKHINLLFSIHPELDRVYMNNLYPASLFGYRTR